MADFTFTQDWENDGLLVWSNAKTLDKYISIKEERREVDFTKFDCFCTFKEEEFYKERQRLIDKGKLKDGEKLVQLIGGVYGTRDGAKRLAEYYKSKREQIAKECDPQEVYCYEFNNYESCIAYDGDKEAITLIIDYWGKEIAEGIKRKRALYSIEEIINE